MPGVGRAEDVSQQAGSRIVMAREGVQLGTDVAGQAVKHGGEKRGLGAEVLEDHGLRHADPGGHVGYLPRAVTGFGEHLGGGRQDRRAPLPGGHPGAPGRLGLVHALHGDPLGS